MKNCLLSIGQFAERSLPVILSSFSCFAAGSGKKISSDAGVSLDIFSLPARASDPVLSRIVDDLNVCAGMFSSGSEPCLFPFHYSFSSLCPDLPSVGDLRSDPSTSLLLDALHGKGLPLSYSADRAAVELAFSSLLSSGESGPLSPLTAWASGAKSCPEAADGLRLMILCDLSDPFSAGAALVLLPWLRSHMNSPSFFAGLVSVSPSSSSSAGSRITALADSLSALNDRDLLRVTDDRGTSGADAAWVISLPSSLRVPDDSPHIAAVAASRALFAAFFNSRLPSAGLHTFDIPSALSFSVLGESAAETAAFIRFAVWWLSDIQPSLQDYIAHPVLLKSLAPATRNGIFRRLFHAGISPSLPDTLEPFRRSVTLILSELLVMIRTMPSSLRSADENLKNWSEAVSACGRFVTTASEYDVLHTEAEDSGVDQVKPVHRASLADTAEEKVQRKLDEMSALLDVQKKERAAALSALGGFRAWQVLNDCLDKCAGAKENAARKFAALAADPSVDNLTLGMQERRVHLLDAALSRCRQDISDASEITSLSSSAPSSASHPFAGAILNEAPAELLWKLLTDSSGSAGAAKEICDNLQQLLFGLPLSDSRGLLRLLSSEVRTSSQDDPFAALLSCMYSVCLGETLSLRFSPPGDLPPLPLLPDALTRQRQYSLQKLISVLPAAVKVSDESHLRGLLAFLLLLQYRKTDISGHSLLMDHLSPESGPLVSFWLGSVRSGEAWVVSVSKGESSFPFAIVLPGRRFMPARLTSSHASVVPRFVTWFDSDSITFLDPLPFLGENDRRILSDQLDCIVQRCSGTISEALLSLITAFAGDLAPDSSTAEDDGLLKSRLLASSLSMLPAYRGSVTRSVSAYNCSLTSDLLMSRLADVEDFPVSASVVPEEVCYCFRGAPFARESGSKLLERTGIQEEEYILSSLQNECSILFHSSDDFHDSLTLFLSGLLARYHNSEEKAVSEATALLDEAKMPVNEKITELVWPWDPLSPAVLTLFRECLGSSLSKSAIRPFSDVITIFPARNDEVICDSLFGRMCLIPPVFLPDDENGIVPPSDSVLPPLSADFASSLCSLPEGRALIHDRLLSFARRDGGKISVELALEGSFSMRLRRVYDSSETISLYSDQIPSLALWPSVPFPSGMWGEYYVYAHLPASLALSVCFGSNQTEETAGSGRHVLSIGAFPHCFVFSYRHQYAGALPNLLPPPEVLPSGPCVVSMDPGGLYCSAALHVGGSLQPLSVPFLLRRLICNPASTDALLRTEFLPATPSSLPVPCAVRSFSVPGDSTGSVKAEPFINEIIPVSCSVEDLLFARPDELQPAFFSGQSPASESCARQLMLLSALQARYSGASSISWRISLSDGITDSMKLRLREMFVSLASPVSEISGLTSPEGVPLVSFSDQSSALAAYFRQCSPEDTRGGFIVLDLGAGTSDLFLFIRGQDTPVRSCHLPLGIHYMLLPGVLRDPDILLRTFSRAQSPGLTDAANTLTDLFRKAPRDPDALFHARLLLDTIISEHFMEVISCIFDPVIEGQPDFAAAFLLLYFSLLMLVSGLVLLDISADPGRNDLLPDQMTVCLAGRGSAILEALPPQAKNSVISFASIFRGLRISSLSVLFSSEKKWEIPIGLSLLREPVTADAVSELRKPYLLVRPEELIPEFLLRFRQKFPAESDLLFPGFFSDDFYHPFTQRGDAFLSASIDSGFSAGPDADPFEALCGCISSLLELIQTEH